MDKRPYDEQYKLLIIGDSSVGKTSILLRFCDQKYYENYVATIGIDYKIKNIQLDNRDIRLQIWDTAGQERFRTITAAYFRKANGIILVYDITCDKSFENILKWLKMIESDAPKDVKIICLGNKCDIPEYRRISQKQAQQLANQYNINFMEVSARENINIEEAFVLLAKQIKDKNVLSNELQVKQQVEESKKESVDSIQLSNNSNKIKNGKKSDSCC